MDTHQFWKWSSASDFDNMNIYFDLEFSKLADDAEAISFGAVASDGQELYIELDPLPLGCSEFVTTRVLPLLQGGSYRCPRQEFAGRLQTWLKEFDDPKLIADSSWDLIILRRTLEVAELDTPGPVQVGSITALLTLTVPPTGAASDAYETARLQCFLRDPRHHHSLVDAKALRAAELAVADILDHGAS